MRALVGVLVALAAALGPRRAQADEASPHDPTFPTQFGLYSGAIYGSASGDEAYFDSFQYLTLGMFIDHEWVHVGMETPGPFLFFDGAVALVAYLAGEDIGVPIFEGLNGDRDPGRVRVVELDAAVRVFHAGPHGVEVGAAFDYSLLAAYDAKQSDDDAQTRHGGSAGNLGPTVGYVLSNDDVLFRARVSAGNGFGSDHDVNPFLSFAVSADVVVARPLMLHVSYDLVGQHLDMRDDDDPDPDFHNDIDEWAAFGTTVVGVGASF